MIQYDPNSIWSDKVLFKKKGLLGNFPCFKRCRNWSCDTLRVTSKDLQMYQDFIRKLFTSHHHHFITLFYKFESKVGNGMPWSKCDTRFSDQKKKRPWAADVISTPDCLQLKICHPYIIMTDDTIVPTIIIPYIFQFSWGRRFFWAPVDMKEISILLLSVANLVGICP